MQGIKTWARQNPDKLAEVLNHNARYVFFQELKADLPGPIGALGVPLDISLTTWMVDLLQQSPDLARRLVTSPMVCLNYHTRPPQPYHVNYDWAGLSALTFVLWLLIPTVDCLRLMAARAWRGGSPFDPDAASN